MPAVSETGHHGTGLPGRMVIFHNTTHDISGPHPLSLHAGMPVEAGEKWAFNMWFRLQDTTTSLSSAACLLYPSDFQIRLRTNNCHRPTTSNIADESATNQTHHANQPRKSIVERHNRSRQSCGYTLAACGKQSSRRNKDLPAVYASYWDTTQQTTTRGPELGRVRALKQPAESA